MILKKTAGSLNYKLWNHFEFFMITECSCFSRHFKYCNRTQKVGKIKEMMQHSYFTIFLCKTWLQTKQQGVLTVHWFEEIRIRLKYKYGQSMSSFSLRTKNQHNLRKDQGESMPQTSLLGSIVLFPENPDLSSDLAC